MPMDPEAQLLEEEPTLVSDPPQLLERSDRYVIEQKLCHGGMAQIFLARRVAGFHKRVVVKSLLPHFDDDPAFVEMLINEARIVAGLCHPNIVRVEDLAEVEGRPFIVMEYLDGRNLRQILQRASEVGQPLSPGVSCHIIAKVLAGLSHAHDHCDDHGRPLGLVHRDVSPANVMVTRAGNVKLIDFGIAKATNVPTDLTSFGQLKGKSAYMSPEQVHCEPLDRRSDLFATGAVLWEMLTRRRLFWRSTDIDTLTAVCDAEIAPPSAWAPELPEGLDAICAKALERDRERRYQTADQMRGDLEELLERNQVTC
jgi:serine/threonine-protein kinase